MLYYLFYSASLILHVVFMNYVLAGSLWLVAAEWKDQGNIAERLAARTLAGNLRDWMPFALSAAVTAGVAPLLFLQLVHQTPFFTANLLLSHRWMLLLPALIAAFYLFYILKTQWLAVRTKGVRVAVAGLAAACVVFIAFSWVRNHVLSTSAEQWPEIYSSGASLLPAKEGMVRLGLWIVGAFSVLCVVLGWQLRLRVGHEHDADRMRVLRRVAIGSQVASIAIVALGAVLLPELVQRPVDAGRWVWVALALCGVGWLGQTWSWLNMPMSVPFGHWRSVVLTVCAGLSMVGVTWVREILRLAKMGIQLSDVPGPAFQPTPFVAFLGFALVNALLIGVVVRIIWRRSQGSL